MKKLIALLLASLMVLSLLTGCGASAEAKAADELINAIGDVTLESGDAIKAAEDAVAKLEQKDKDKLAGLSALEEARKTYDDLVKKDNKAKVSAVEKLIDAIGEVTGDSEAAIQEARKAFDALPEELQDELSNAKVLTQAEGAYQELLNQVTAVEDAIKAIDPSNMETIDAAKAAYDALPDSLKAKVSNADDLTTAIDNANKEIAGMVDELIGRIGTVTLDSRDAIETAQGAYDILTEEQKAYVTKADELASAAAAYKELREAENKRIIDELLPKMDVENDPIFGNTFYYHPTMPEYIDERPYLLPYIGQNKNGQVWLCVRFDYTGDDWVFWKTLVISVDGDLSFKVLNYFDVTRDNQAGYVWEYYDAVDPNDYDMGWLRSIPDSDTTIVRFAGDDYSYDLEISAEDKIAIAEILALYYALGGK